MKKNTITLIASSGLFTNFLWRFRHDFCCTFRKNNTSNHASYTITRIFIWKNSAFWHFSQKGSFLPPALASRKRKWYDISGAFFSDFFFWNTNLQSIHFPNFLPPHFYSQTTEPIWKKNPPVVLCCESESPPKVFDDVHSTETVQRFGSGDPLLHGWFADRHG